jgi:hypothetical protein
LLTTERGQVAGEVRVEGGGMVVTQDPWLIPPSAIEVVYVEQVL